MKQSALITADMPDRSFLSKPPCLRTYNLDWCGERTHNLDKGEEETGGHNTPKFLGSYFALSLLDLR